MQRALPLILFLALFSAVTQAQDIRYVSDKIFIVLHKGPGTDYRWKAKLTPGTRLTLAGLSDDNKWAEVTTDRGTTGWVQQEFLSNETPAQLKLPAAVAEAETLSTSNQQLSTELDDLKEDRVTLLNQITATETQLRSVTEELGQLKKISGKAVELDVDNQRLVEESEDLRSNTEMLEAENQRLQDKIQNQSFIDGALAVLLGVIITLVAPRLWPQHRKSSSWA